MEIFLFRDVSEGRTLYAAVVARDVEAARQKVLDEWKDGWKMDLMVRGKNLILPGTPDVSYQFCVAD